MGLADVQRVLARLYTETELRARFFAAPEAVGATLGLTAAEIEQLKPLSQVQTERFGRALQHKRRNEVEKLLPLSYRALGRRFGALFQAHADRWVPSGIHKHVDDALTFAATAARSLRGEGAEFVWLAELLRYEATCLRAYHGRRALYCALFRMPIRRIAAQMAATGRCAPVPYAPCLLVWIRPRRNAPLRLFTLALPTHSLKGHLRQQSAQSETQRRAHLEAQLTEEEQRHLARLLARNRDEGLSDAEKAEMQTLFDRIEAVATEKAAAIWLLSGKAADADAV